MNHRPPVHEPAADPLPLENGDHLDQPTFHRLYEAMPAGFKCELIGGIAYVMASPLKFAHSFSHIFANNWLFSYFAATPGTFPTDNATHIFSSNSELQPDATLFVLPEFGGSSRIGDNGYIFGSPELALEIASSSKAIDLGAKKIDYEKAGVREYVVVLTQEKRVRWFTRQGKKFATLAPGADGIFRSLVFPGLWLAPEGLTKGDNARLREVLVEGLATAEHTAFVEKLKAAQI